MNHALISLTIARTAAKASFPTGLMCDAGNMKPCRPVSRNSIVYAYLIFAAPLAQSSAPPD